MAGCASTWAPLVYPLVLHANTRVRERALVAMEKGMAAMISQQNDVARCLANDLRDVSIFFALQLFLTSLHCFNALKWFNYKNQRTIYMEYIIFS